MIVLFFEYLLLRTRQLNGFVGLRELSKVDPALRSVVVGFEHRVFPIEREGEFWKLLKHVKLVGKGRWAVRRWNTFRLRTLEKVGCFPSFLFLKTHLLLVRGVSKLDNQRDGRFLLLMGTHGTT